MDALGILERDHYEAKSAMDDIAASIGPRKKDLFKALKRGLEAHDRIEATVFYPAMAADPKTAGFARGDQTAQGALEQDLSRLALLPQDDPEWTPTFDAMRARLLKHFHDDEEEAFIKIRELMGAAALVVLGEKMRVEKIRLLKPV